MPTASPASASRRVNARSSALGLGSSLGRYGDGELAAVTVAPGSAAGAPHSPSNSTSATTGLDGDAPESTEPRARHGNGTASAHRPASQPAAEVDTLALKAAPATFRIVVMAACGSFVVLR